MIILTLCQCMACVWYHAHTTTKPFDPGTEMTRRKEIDCNTILDAAETIIGTQGIHRLTLDEVAAKAGVSKGGLTYNFKSKDELISAMVHRENMRFNTEVARYREQFSDAPNPGLSARIAVARSENAFMINKAASAIAALQLSKARRESMEKQTRADLEEIDITTEQGRKELVAFFAVEGLFYIRGLRLLNFSEQEWQSYMDIVRDVCMEDASAPEDMG